MEATLEEDAPLASAALINGVVNDLLYQCDFELPHYPEWVDLAVVATGLGVPRSGVGFVKKTGLYWDSTHWTASPRPFLNIPSLAYANAMAAWIRGETAPAWANDLNGEIKRPMRSSLKYLVKTQDAFFGPSDLSTLAADGRTDRGPAQWWTLAGDAEPSSRIIALRGVTSDGPLSPEHESILVDALGSKNRAIVLNAIAAVERLKVETETIVDELRSLVNDRDDEIRAKSLCTLTVMSQLDEPTIELAADMLDSHFKHNVFAGVLALGSRDSIAEPFVPNVQRAFMRSLKSCDYEFVGLFSSAFHRWFDDPRSYVQEWLQDDSPELLEIALEALEGTPPEPVAIG